MRKEKSDCRVATLSFFPTSYGVCTGITILTMLCPQDFLRKSSLTLL
ncbi:hypothetical protein LINGRAHAP2_LOCUS17590 [Linum grandiflorum]